MCSTCTPHYTLEESDDDGAHWSARTVPAAILQYQSTGNMFIYLYVSPLQPQVLIMAASGNFGSTCSSAPTASLTQASQEGPLAQHAPDSSPVCAEHFYSGDGGSTWRQITLPAAGILSPSALQLLQASALRARGSALYSTISPLLPGYSGAQPGDRLVESDDDGLTWQSIDGPLVAAGQSVYDFALVPGSSSMYAVTDDAAASEPPYTTHYELWRSDDDGAHWRQLPAPPAQDLGGLFAGDLPGASQPVIYLYAPLATKSQAQSAQVFASTDDGQHWSAMPSTGLAGTYSIAAAPIGTLADGSLVVPFDNSSYGLDQGPLLTFCSWAPGQTQVRAIGSPLTGGFSSALLVPASSASPASLWVIYNSPTINIATAWLALTSA